MVASFGLHDGYQLPRFRSERLVQANPRVDVFALNRQGLLVSNASARLETAYGGYQLARDKAGILVDGTRILLTWDELIPGVGRPWFECPRCRRRCRRLYLRQLACRHCSRLDYACRHMHRSVPGLHRLLHLRRKIGASQAPFTPIAARPRNHTRYHRIVAEIRALEVGLIGHLGSVVHDLERRIRVRKAGEVVGSPSMKDEITNQRLLRIAQDHRCTVDDVNAALNHHPIEIDRTTYVRRLLALELVELDELAEAFRDKAIVDRDVASGALLTKIHERRATLLGLNAPQSAAVAIIDERPFAQTSTDKIEAAVNRIRGARLPAPEASDKPN